MKTENKNKYKNEAAASRRDMWKGGNVKGSESSKSRVASKDVRMWECSFDELWDVLQTHRRDRLEGA